MLLLGVCTGADSGDALVDERGRVRHCAYDRDAGREPRLDLGGGDRCGDREHRLLRRQESADLAEQNVEVLRLDGDDDEASLGDGVRIGKRRLDAVFVGEFLQAFLAPSGDDDVARLAPAGTEQPGEERLADLPGAEDCDPSIPGRVASQPCSEARSRTESRRSRTSSRCS